MVQNLDFMLDNHCPWLLLWSRVNLESLHLTSMVELNKNLGVVIGSFLRDMLYKNLS